MPQNVNKRFNKLTKNNPNNLVLTFWYDFRVQDITKTAACKIYEIRSASLCRPKAKVHMGLSLSHRPGLWMSRIPSAQGLSPYAD